MQLSTEYFSLNKITLKTYVYAIIKPCIIMVNGKLESFVINKIYCEKKHEKSQICGQMVFPEVLLCLLEKGDWKC